MRLLKKTSLLFYITIYKLGIYQLGAQEHSALLCYLKWNK